MSRSFQKIRMPLTRGIITKQDQHSNLMIPISYCSNEKLRLCNPLSKPIQTSSPIYPYCHQNPTGAPDRQNSTSSHLKVPTPTPQFWAQLNLNLLNALKSRILKTTPPYVADDTLSTVDRTHESHQIRNEGRSVITLI
jgi:hypothetical protein